MMTKDIFELITDYLAFINDVRGHTKTIVATKRHHLKIFAEYIGEQNLSNISIRETHQFLSYLKEKDRGFHSRYFETRFYIGSAVI